MQGPRWKGVDGEGGDWIVVCSGAEMEGSRWRGGGGWLKCCVCRRRDGRESMYRGMVGVLCVQETRWKGVGGEGVVAVLCVHETRWKGVDGEGGGWSVLCAGDEMEGSRWRGGWLECCVCRGRDGRESTERGVIGVRDGRESVERGVVGVLCVQETRWKGVGGEGGGWSVVCAGGMEGVDGEGLIGLLCVQGPRWKGVGGEGGGWSVVSAGAEMEGSRRRGG